MRILLLFCIAASALSGKYSNLIATSDGEAVYFQVHTGPITDKWYVARTAGGAVSVTPIDGQLADVDGAGAVLAKAGASFRSCNGNVGSPCVLAPACIGSFQIEGPGFNNDDVYSGPWTAFIRLSRSGKYVWISENYCGGTSKPPLLNGLYEPDSLKLLAAEQYGYPANSRVGRRAITDGGRALTILNAQLEWLDGSGVHLIRNVYGAAEAVTDSQGANIVYSEGIPSELHWVTGPDWLGAEDVKLGLQGTAPALTDDGSSLLFLAPDNSLRLYVRSTRELKTLGSEKYSSFTTAGGVAFASTQDGYLVRIDLSSGDKSTWLEPFVEIDSIEAAAPFAYKYWCQYICYGQQEIPKIISPGMDLVLGGSSLSAPGWRVRVAGVEMPLLPLSDTAAWFQIPSSASGSFTTVEVFKPDFLISYSFIAEVRSSTAACFGTLHQDFSREVTANDPAVPGEVVHVFLSGLQGVETVANGVPNPLDHLIAVANPPPLYDPRSLQTLFFGLAPGSIGLQQLDLRILQRPTGDLFFPQYPYANPDSYFQAFSCSAPAVAAP